jgi:hypothetical protein
LEEGSLWELNVVVDCCIDGTQADEKSDVKMNLVFSTKFPNDIMVKVEVQDTSKESVEPVKK